MPADFQAACSRAPACAAAEPGSVWARIGALAASLRAKPVSGTVPGPSGKLEKVSIGVTGLVDLVNDAAEDRQVYRDLDAAARALLEGGDAAPLLRLYAQRLAVDEAYFGLPTSEYSVDLYFAVGCLDYPQLFEHVLRAVAAARASWLPPRRRCRPAPTVPSQPPSGSPRTRTPRPTRPASTGPRRSLAQPPLPAPPPLLASTVPVLVLGGELDAWTPPVDVPKVLAEVGGHSRFIELANSTHVVGEAETLCGSALVRAFVAHPTDLDTLDASCAPTVAPIHAVGSYPERLAAVSPLEPSPGDSASPTALRLAAAAVQTAGDAIARYEATEAGHDRGLHGGSVTVSRGGLLLTLRRDQLVPGVPVSGTVTLARAALAEDGQTAVAALTVSGEGGPPATLTATWTTSGSGATARVAGEADGAVVSGTLPAP